MHPVLKRIVVTGAITALILAVIGVGYAELATLWLSAKDMSRGPMDVPLAAAPAEDPIAASLRSRVPLLMAAWGFLFVAVGEGLLYLWRGRPRPPLERKPAPARTDPAELLLEQILAEVEAAEATPSAATSSPSATPAENSPVAH